jgi:signal transduction histidine kinase
LGSMIGILRRLRRDLRTTLVGADPARPLMPPRPLWSALGILVIISLGAMATQYLTENRDLALPVAAAVGTLTVLSLVFVRYKPLWAWRFAAVSLLVGLVDYSPPTEAWPWNPVQILATLVVLFVVGLREPAGVIFWAGLITIVVIWVIINAKEMVGITILIAALMLFGEQIQRRRRAQLELKEQAERSEILTERARIARELHDVVAHSLSLVAVRAETAPYRLGEMPGPAREEFLALAGTARESLTELRRLLGVLRTERGSDTGSGAARTPQPTLSDVDELIGTMRAAGMDISYVGTHFELPAATGLTVYRIVQEALSNAARHAPGAPVRVAITRAGELGAGELRVDVHNGPSSDAVVPTGKGGHGLVGMRERVLLLGGSLDYGRSEDGGFSVSAVMPLD